MDPAAAAQHWDDSNLGGASVSGGFGMGTSNGGGDSSTRPRADANADSNADASEKKGNFERFQMVSEGSTKGGGGTTCS